MKPPEYFTSRILTDGTSDCWLWIGPRNAKGYGISNSSGGTRGAHRRMYEMRRGPIPAGMHLDHLCRFRSCVNPDHLEVVTPRENVIRGRLGAMDRSRFSSPYLGVCRISEGRWIAKFCLNGAPRYVGIFDDDREAALAYDEAVRADISPDAPTNATLGLLAAAS